MSTIDQALLSEVKSLLANKPESIKTKPSSPLSNRRAKADAAAEDHPSVFYSTWSLLSNSFEDGAGAERDDFSDLAASLSGMNGNVFNSRHHQQLPLDGTESFRSFELSETDLLSSCNSVGPPSLQDSSRQLQLQDEPRVGEHYELPPSSKVNARNSSRILTHSKAALSIDSNGNPDPNNNNEENLPRISSSGLNAILLSSPSVGSTHRAASSVLGPRSCQDYLMKVKDSESLKKVQEIPAETYKYKERKRSEKFKPITIPPKGPPSDRGLKTPVLEDGTKYSGSPMSKSFLDSVNEQIRHIKYEQARERALRRSKLNSSNNAIRMGDDLPGTPVVNQDQDPAERSSTSGLEIMSIGTTDPLGGAISSWSSRPSAKVDLGLQTDLDADNSMAVSPWGWGLGSKTDSQLSIMSLKTKRLGCGVLPSTRPVFRHTDSNDGSQERFNRQAQFARSRARAHRNLRYFENFWSLSNAMTMTKYSLQAAWNTAEEVFYGCIVPQEIEDQPPIEDNVGENEDKIAVSVMRLMGVPIVARHAIYREVLSEIHALNDFSVGTVAAISNVIDWICTGSNGGTEALIAKTRLLATSQTEVDPDSETWKTFERDMRIFTNAVVNSVGTAARAVSRRAPEESNDSLTSVESIDTTAGAPQSESDQQSEFPTPLETINNNARQPEDALDNKGKNLEPKALIKGEEDAEESDPPISPELISQLVTDSELDLPPMTPVIRTDSSMSRTSVASSLSRKSRIPIRVHFSQSELRSSSGDKDLINSINSVLRQDATADLNVNSDSNRNLIKPDEKKGISREESFASCMSISKLHHRSSNGNIPTTSKPSCKPVAEDVEDPNRERQLSPQDTLLLKECRRLTSYPNSDESSPYPAGSEADTRTGSPQQRCPGMANIPPAYFGIPTGEEQYLPTDLTQLASAIASVATSVTSNILSRATSAASYIPSFNDTFGPQVDEECRFPECTHEDGTSGNISILDTLQQAASNMIFGYNDPSLESCLRQNRNVRSSNRFLSPPIKGSNSQAPLLESRSCSSKPGSRGPNSSFNLTNPSSVQQHNQPGGELPSYEPVPYSAWAMFDYIKRIEAETIINVNNRDGHGRVSRRQSEQGINEQSPPDNYDGGAGTATPPNRVESASLTARLSQAALKGLFSTFKDSIPAPLVTVPESSSGSNSPARYSIQPDILQARKCPSPTQLTPLSVTDLPNHKTQSGHSYTLNPRASSTSNLNSSGCSYRLRTPSVPLIYAPQNSDLEFTRQMAESGMQEDLTYLEGVMTKFYDESFQKVPIVKNVRRTENPQQQQQQQRSRSHQLSPRKSKIPLLREAGNDSEPSSPSMLQRNAQGSNLYVEKSVTEIPSTNSSGIPCTFSVGPGSKSSCKIKNDLSDRGGASLRTRIVHPTPSSQNRNLPMKSKPQVNSPQQQQQHQQIRPPVKNITSPHISNESSYSASANSSAKPSRAPSKVSTTSCNNSSYLAIMSKQKLAGPAAPVRSPSKYGGSYSRRHSSQERHQAGQAGVRKNDGHNNKFRAKPNNNSEKVLSIKYANGAHNNNGSSQCSSPSYSTGPVSMNPSVQPISNNTNVPESPGKETTTSDYAHLKNAPLFFPPLDNRRASIPLPSVLMRPFTKLRGSDGNASPGSKGSPSPSTPNSD